MIRPDRAHINFKIELIEAGQWRVSNILMPGKYYNMPRKWTFRRGRRDVNPRTLQSQRVRHPSPRRLSDINFTVELLNDAIAFASASFEFFTVENCS